MASHSPSIFDTPDRLLIRLRKMCEAASTKGLLKVLHWLNPNWIPPLSFWEYLEKEKHIVMADFDSDLNQHQRDALQKDPEGNTYDITFVCILIQWGNEGLADEKERERLKNLITKLKKERNDLSHPYKPIDGTEFHERTETLRSLLKEMMTSAGAICNITETEVDHTLQELNTIIDKICGDPLDPSNSTDYRNELLLSQHIDFVKNYGATALRIRHEKYSSLTPASLLAKVKFQVDDVFTDMIVMAGEDQQEKLELADLFEVQKQSSADDLILLEGEAGIGKTTLTRKLLIDWTKKISKIKHIESYDLVIHAECREHVESFKVLLDLSMTEVSKSLNAENMVFATLCLKSLIIIDGLDELNKKSTRLFQEILKLKKDYDITVLVTSRSEAVEKYFQYARTYQIETKHILLLGIPEERREDFVRNYFDGLRKTGLATQSIEGLLKYLKRTEHRLGYLWRSPYNLTILTILWAMKPDVVNSITTAPELHWEIHQLSLSKLKERLENNETTRHLSSSQLEEKINTFIYIFCRESLTALANDDITLPEETYKRLENICHELDLPVEEMAGAFLKRIFTHSSTRYSFPHKGLQDFFAALFIWLRLTPKPLSSDAQKVLKAVSDVFSKNVVPLHVCQNILKFSEVELVKESSVAATPFFLDYNEQIMNDVSNFLSQKAVPTHVRQRITGFIINEVRNSNAKCTAYKPNNTDNDKAEICDYAPKEDNAPKEFSQHDSRIRDEKFERHSQDDTFILSRTLVTEKTITNIIIEETSLHGLLPELSKFRNMLVALIGLFYIHRSSVSDEAKTEVLNLLVKTGINDKDAWLNILNSVRCDDYVANFISQQPYILEGEVRITDSTIFAYISLLQALKAPVNDINIDLEVKGDLMGLNELLEVISFHQCKVNSILISNNNYVDYTELFKSLKTTLREPNTLNIDIHVNKELLEISSLILEIKRHNFIIRQLEVKDCQINDFNLSGYISAFESMPPLPGNASNMGIDIFIEGDLLSASEILQLISTHQFRIKSILVTDNNIAKYIELLEALTTPLREPNMINFTINLRQKAPLPELIEVIKKGNFTVRLMKVKDYQIVKSNLLKCLSMLRSLPTLTKISNQTNIGIDLRGDIAVAGVLLELLSVHHFQITRIVITMNNYVTYNSVLKNLQTPLRDPHKINVELCTDTRLEHLYDLIEEINKREMNIALLKGMKVVVNDSNINDYISFFRLLPPMSKENNETAADINVLGDLTGAEELLQLITSRHFRVKSILITVSNYKSYTTMLKALQEPFESPHEVNIDIKVTDNISVISDLLNEIKDKNLTIRTLNVKKSETTDQNVH